MYLYQCNKYEPNQLRNSTVIGTDVHTLCHPKSLNLLDLYTLYLDI